MTWPKALPDEEYNRRWIARVLANTERTESGCLLWTGFIHSARGYGQTPYRLKNVHVHRMLYQLVHGVRLGRWEFVCHSCDVRLCVNIDHLWVGSPNDNNQDMVQKKRTKRYTMTHCKHGHEFTPENTYIPPRGWRQCRECARIKNLKAQQDGRAREWQKRRRERRKAARLQSIGDGEHR